MIFTFRKWNAFCKTLKQRGLLSIPAKDVRVSPYLVLKHDVETNVKKAYKMAMIEHRHGHRGSYYVQAYLLKNPKNILLLSKMKKMGHEISYHYDVMDSCKGNLQQAIAEFEKNKEIFETNGFDIVTVCQHGNPLIERVGYYSNRDFFRSEEVQRLYPNIADIMVDYKTKYNTDYKYFSDAGRKFKMIFDPLFNDITPSSDKDISYNTIFDLLDVVSEKECFIISTHPHRYCSSALIYLLKAALFSLIKIIAKALYKIPFMKKFMNKYYYLAKKI